MNLTVIYGEFYGNFSEILLKMTAKFTENIFLEFKNNN